MPVSFAAEAKRYVMHGNNVKSEAGLAVRETNYYPENWILLPSPLQSYTTSQTAPKLWVKGH